MAKKKILMVCEAFGGGVFTYVSQLCNDMVDDFDVYLAYSLRPQTPKNYKDFLNQRVHLIEMKNVGVKGLTNLKSDIAAIKELRQIEKDVQPDVIHLHSSVAGGLGRLAYKGKNNTVVYTPHGYAHILMGPGKKSKVYKFAEKVLGNRALTLTCCESEDEEAKKFSKRTAYVETGVNLADLSTSLDGIKPVKNDRFTVFTLGRACVQKQPQLFNKIAELVPDARFVWIGNGELENELKAPNIEVTGWKPRKEALAMAKGADAFILCSLGEAIAMSLIENMYKKRSEALNDLALVFKKNHISYYYHLVRFKNEPNPYNFEYHDPLIYPQVIEYIRKSKVIIDLVAEWQNGITLRPLEGLFFKKKLITNMKEITGYDFYNPQNIFVLGVDDLSHIKEFVESPYYVGENYSELINRYSMQGWLNNFTLSE